MYTREGDVCYRSSSEEPLVYHGAARHIISHTGREQLLKYIIALETSHRSPGQRTCPSWVHKFAINQYASDASGVEVDSDEQQQQQLIACHSIAKGDTLGLILGRMLPSHNAEQQLLSTAKSARDDALQTAKHTFSFVLGDMHEQQPQELTPAAADVEGHKCITVVAYDCFKTNPLAKVQDYRHCSCFTEVLGPRTPGPNAALLPVSHNPTGKVYLAAVALREISPGSEITIDKGSATYIQSMRPLLQRGLKWMLHGQPQQQQQQQQQQHHGLAVCPVPVGENATPGKLHKSLLSQVLAALATCRKLPSGHRFKQDMDKLLQQTLSLAHAAAVAWSSAAATAKLEPGMVYQQQQQSRQQHELSHRQQAHLLSDKEWDEHQLVGAATEVQNNTKAAVQRLSPERYSSFTQQTEIIQSGMVVTPAAVVKKEKRVTWQTGPQLEKMQENPVLKTATAPCTSQIQRSKSLQNSAGCAAANNAVGLASVSVCQPTAAAADAVGQTVDDLCLAPERSADTAAATAHVQQQMELDGYAWSSTRGSHHYVPTVEPSLLASRWSRSISESEDSTDEQEQQQQSADEQQQQQQQQEHWSDSQQQQQAQQQSKLFTQEIHQSDRPSDMLQHLQQQQELLLENKKQQLLQSSRQHENTNAGWRISSSWQPAEDSSNSLTIHAAAAAANPQLPELQAQVRQLISQEKNMQRCAANALMNLAYTSADSRAAIAAAGAVPALVAMLQSSSRSCQIAASGSLSNLCIDNQANQAAIAGLGGVQMLTGLLSSSSTSVQRAAARALNNLAWDIDNRAVIAAAGGISQLVQLLSSDCTDIKEHAAAALMNMARDIIYGIPVAIAEAGGIPALIRLLDATNSEDVQDSAAGALMNLSYSTPHNRAAIAAAGGIRPLVNLLASRNTFVQRSAAGALKNISRDSPENQVAIAEAGGIPVLVWILQGSKDDAKFEAAGALWNLIHDNPANHAELTAAGGMAPLVAMIGKMRVGAHSEC